MIDGLTEEQQKCAFDFLKDASKAFFTDDSETADVIKALDLKRLKSKKLPVKEIPENEEHAKSDYAKGGFAE